MAANGMAANGMAANGMPMDPIAFDRGRTALPRSLLFGERRGKIVSKAGEFLNSLSTHSACFPIFKSNFTRSSGELNQRGRALLQHDAPDTMGHPGLFPPGKWHVNVDIPAQHPPPTLRKEIIRQVDKALVFLIAIKAPHALIVIRTPDGKNYSCGYGYFGHVNAGEVSKLQRVHKVTAKLVKDSAAHTIQPLRGALYTADYMTPNQTHEAKIIWVGLLSQEIINNINTTLATAVELNIGGNYEDISSEYICETCDTRTVAPIKNVACMDSDCNGNMRLIAKPNIISILEMKLSVNSIYLESAAFIKNGFYNCFEWAKSILGIQYLNCGFTGNPFNCVHVTNEEIGNVLAYSTNLDQLRATLTTIQDRLYVPGYLRTISDCLGCSSKLGRPKSVGGRRRKINKKYTKRRRLQLHSSRRRRSIGKK
jgi:hypothetical protein